MKLLNRIEESYKKEISSTTDNYRYGILLDRLYQINLIRKRKFSALVWFLLPVKFQGMIKGI